MYMNQINALTLQRSKTDLDQWKVKTRYLFIFHPDVFMEIFNSYLNFWKKNVIHTLAVSFMKRILKRKEKY